MSGSTRKYNVVVEFGLTTEIECDLSYHTFDFSEVEDGHDESYFSTQEVEVDGGSLRFVVEAEDEDAAEAAARTIVNDGHEVEDSNGVTWLVGEVSIDLDEIEEEMTVESAKQTILDYLDNSEVPSEVVEAIRFLLAASSTPFDS